MEHKTYHIEGPIEFFPRIFKDDRGYFLETYSLKMFEPLGIMPGFVQDNQSVSKKSTLRGLHFQKPPYAQGKLVRVATGRAMDVAVDLRRSSPTYGEHISCMLDAEKGNMLYIPEGFAHGFVALEDNTTFLYKCTNYYHQPSEGGILWNDPALGIDWMAEKPLLSPKDEILPLLKDLNSPF